MTLLDSEAQVTVILGNPSIFPKGAFYNLWAQQVKQIKLDVSIDNVFLKQLPVVVALPVFFSAGIATDVLTQHDCWTNPNMIVGIIPNS